jgi:hypothetical protein
MDAGMHAMFSAVNIPLNAIACACASIAFAFFSTQFLLSAAIKATTDLELPGTTSCVKMLFISINSAHNIYTDARDMAYDTAATLRKAAQKLKLNNALDRIQQLWLYIPRALFERSVSGAS